MRDGDDNHGYWFGYMLGTVKDCARRTHDKSCIDSLRVFCETSRLAHPSDLEALNKALGDDDPLSPNAQTEVDAVAFVHLRRAAGGISLVIRHMHQWWGACLPCAPLHSPHSFPGTRPEAFTASREPATIGRIGMAAHARRLIERSISVDHDDVGNCNARSPGA